MKFLKFLIKNTADDEFTLSNCKHEKGSDYLLLSGNIEQLIGCGEIVFYIGWFKIFILWIIWLDMKTFSVDFMIVVLIFLFWEKLDRLVW